MKHVVMFKYKPDSPLEHRQQVALAFEALQEVIPGIMCLEHGQSESREGLDQGFHHVFLLTFQNAQALDSYLPHPAHKAFGDLVKQLGVLESVFVVDFMPQGKSKH